MPSSSASSSSSSSPAAAGAGPAAAIHVRQHPLLFSARFRLDPRARGGGDRRTAAMPGLALAAEGPSCLFVGPIETASKERLEALYRQARDSYYSGQPLIVDDMFDRVELKLRLYGSKSVVKYPRCSLRRQSTYADAEEDPSQVLALGSVWMLLLVLGTSVCLVPTIYAISLAFNGILGSKNILNGGKSPFEELKMVNDMLFMGLGYLIGYPIASASDRQVVFYSAYLHLSHGFPFVVFFANCRSGITVRALEGLWKNDLIALKGSCPNCGEEVFAFVKSGKSSQPPHRAECHVCECTLEYRTKVEQSLRRPGRNWVYGRVYLVPGSSPQSRRRM